MLTEDNCRNCEGAGLEMLMWYNEAGESFLSWIVIGDETLLHYWMPECNSISMVWKMTDKTALRKLTELSAGKV